MRKTNLGNWQFLRFISLERNRLDNYPSQNDNPEKDNSEKEESEREHLKGTGLKKDSLT